MHEDVALEFARWLSPKFAIWCSDRIKELLTSTQQPVKAEILPPPIDNSLSHNALVENINGKLFTTSRKLAQALGRKHDRILETIRSNRHLRAFKYGHFTTRAYSSGASHGYEFLITCKGLDALASVMRYNAKERIAQAYDGAWDSSIRGAVLPTTKALPASIQSHDQGEETTHTSEQQEYIDWLEGYNEELGSRLRKTKNTMKLYSELYSQEMNRRKRAEGMSGYWHDLYEDLMLRMENMGDNASVHLLEAHHAFRLRLERKG